MDIVGKQKIYNFRASHADAKSSLDSLEEEIKTAKWSTPQELKQRYPKASILFDNQVVFNVRGNKYRLLVKINYNNEVVIVKKIGNHDEYMKWGLA